MLKTATTFEVEKASSFITKMPRLDSIDLLRGIVLLLMALDHSRHYFSNIDDPLNLSVTTPFLFFTRWITHFCAPIFIFLAGISAYLFEVRSQCTKSALCRYLFTRGIWFIFLECTLIYAIWTFYLVPYRLSLQIFWVIGFSMVTLAFLVYLPRQLVLAISLAVLIGHNLLDTITTSAFHYLGWFWHIVHVKGEFQLSSHIRVMIWYPVIPWIAVMSLGYAMGPIVLWPEQLRRQFFIRIGIAICLLFFTVRFLNQYGDPQIWHSEKNALFTFLSFLNCEKYPPSLDYLLMTLGPAFIFLGSVRQTFCQNAISQILIRFGKVPFFFYILHVPLIFALVLSLAYWHGGLVGIKMYFYSKTAYHYDLFLVYVVWFSIIAILYPLCVWYGKFKSSHRHRILSYI